MSLKCILHFFGSINKISVVNMTLWTVSAIPQVACVLESQERDEQAGAGRDGSDFISKSHCFEAVKMGILL